ncbi:hypothetical protein GHT06_006750 [Daphnia sinensis]|uniref:Uncharacterized protein n=1 Tax=Daphnia sinensis TaxID=1820382 RepID=A0AAD5KFA0_9CRUS|nr:hypothetical protein GHT06_006750 [Daphnia sinensis]
MISERCGKPWQQFGRPPIFVPAKFVHGQLQRRQATACSNHGGRPDICGSALIVRQRVRAFVSGLWLAGAVENICSDPDSYVVRLADGRAFHRTRRDINVDNSPSAGFGAGQKVGSAPVPSSAARGYRPTYASSLLPALSWHPLDPPTRAVNGQVAQSFPVAVSQQSTVSTLPPVVVNSSSGPASPVRTQTALALAGQTSSAQ